MSNSSNLSTIGTTDPDLAQLGAEHLLRLAKQKLKPSLPASNNSTQGQIVSLIEGPSKENPDPATLAPQDPIRKNSKKEKRSYSRFSKGNVEDCTVKKKLRLKDLFFPEKE